MYVCVYVCACVCELSMSACTCVGCEGCVYGFCKASESVVRLLIDHCLTFYVALNVALKRSLLIESDLK